MSKAHWIERHRRLRTANIQSGVFLNCWIDFFLRSLMHLWCDVSQKYKLLITPQMRFCECQHIVDKIAAYALHCHYAIFYCCIFDHIQFIGHEDCLIPNDLQHLPCTFQCLLNSPESHHLQIGNSDMTQSYIKMYVAIYNLRRKHN